MVHLCRRRQSVLCPAIHTQRMFSQISRPKPLPALVIAALIGTDPSICFAILSKFLMLVTISVWIACCVRTKVRTTRTFYASWHLSSPPHTDTSAARTPTHRSADIDSIRSLGCTLPPPPENGYKKGRPEGRPIYCCYVFDKHYMLKNRLKVWRKRYRDKCHLKTYIIVNIISLSFAWKFFIIFHNVFYRFFHSLRVVTQFIYFFISIFHR
jgi:hypothetical protein